MRHLIFPFPEIRKIQYLVSRTAICSWPTIRKCRSALLWPPNWRLKKNSCSISTKWKNNSPRSVMEFPARALCGLVRELRSSSLNMLLSMVPHSSNETSKRVTSNWMQWIATEPNSNSYPIRKRHVWHFAGLAWFEGGEEEIHQSDKTFTNVSTSLVRWNNFSELTLLKLSIFYLLANSLDTPRHVTVNDGMTSLSVSLIEFPLHISKT